jgi:hypothetical protein
LVYLVGLVQPNTRDKPTTPEQLAFAATLAWLIRPW